MNCSGSGGPWTRAGDSRELACPVCGARWHQIAGLNDTPGLTVKDHNPQP